MRSYYVYILANRSRMLFIGVTNDLQRRLHEHRQKLVPGFTQKYNLSQLVYYETTPNISAAIQREKQLKGWRRAKKVALIESVNHDWRDLSGDWRQAPA
jgi:putative endonuclease